MTGRKSSLKGWKIDKAGQLVRDERKLPVSTKIAKGKSAKRPRVVSRAKAGAI